MVKKVVKNLNHFGKYPVFYILFKSIYLVCKVYKFVKKVTGCLKLVKNVVKKYVGCSKVSNQFLWHLNLFIYVASNLKLVKNVVSHLKPGSYFN